MREDFPLRMAWILRGPPWFRWVPRIPVAKRPSGAPGAAGRSDLLQVLYFGGYIPLHGVDVILEAARRLGPTAGITFTLVGDGQDAPAAAAFIKQHQLTHVRMVRDMDVRAEADRALRLPVGCVSRNLRQLTQGTRRGSSQGVPVAGCRPTDPLRPEPGRGGGAPRA